MDLVAKVLDVTPHGSVARPRHTRPIVWLVVAGCLHTPTATVSRCRATGPDPGIGPLTSARDDKRPPGFPVLTLIPLASVGTLWDHRLARFAVVVRHLDGSFGLRELTLDRPQYVVDGWM